MVYSHLDSSATIATDHITVVRRRRPILLLEVSLEGSLTNSMKHDVCPTSTGFSSSHTRKWPAEEELYYIYYTTALGSSPSQVYNKSFH